MQHFSKEHELRPPVTHYFQQQGYQVFSEIRIGYCRADLIALNNTHVIAVELKLSDWKKALIQLKNYQLGADYVYLAVPLMNIYSLLRKHQYTLIGNHIGVLTVNEHTKQVHTLISAQQSTKTLGKITIDEINGTKSKLFKRRML